MSIATIVELVKVAISLAPEVETLIREIEKVIADAKAKLKADKAGQ
jgi:hypothetical protein